MTEAIFKMSLDFGRMGELEGKFISTVEAVDALIKTGVKVYFGEVLGKHSEVFCAIKEDAIELVSDDPNVVKVFKENNLESGYNPFNYTMVGMSEEWDDCTVDYYIDSILKTGQD